MLQPRVKGFLKTICLTALIVCSGCAAGAATEPIAPDYVLAEVQIGSAREVVSEGRVDTGNRYMSTVMVTTAFPVPKQGTKVKTCSGVLIEAHAVLTAGHCVCDLRRPVPPEASDAAVIDPSTCAKTANITLLRYQSREMARAMPGDGTSVPPAVNIGPYRGTVQVHEDLRILYKELETGTGWEMNTEYSNADIAVIILEESLQGYVPPIKLAEEPVRIKERILLVGYGAEIPGQAFDTPVRRYGENAVVSIKEDGSTFHIGTQLERAQLSR